MQRMRPGVQRLNLRVRGFVDDGVFEDLDAERLQILAFGHVARCREDVFGLLAGRRGDQDAGAVFVLLHQAVERNRRGERRLAELARHFEVQEAEAAHRQVRAQPPAKPHGQQENLHRPQAQQAGVAERQRQAFAEGTDGGAVERREEEREIFSLVGTISAFARSARCRCASCCTARQATTRPSSTSCRYCWPMPT